MTRGFLSGCAVVLLSQMVSLGALAQTPIQPHPPADPSGVSIGTPSSDPASVAVAPNPVELPEAIARQRQALAVQRSAIAQAEAAQQAVCWQKFAVNACLSEARRTRRQALEPLRQQELALNAQERLWRTEQREKRLLDKQATPRETP